MLGRVLGKKATPVVSVVSLRGVVDAKLEDRLDRQMLRVSKESVALAVLIDSPGGSPAYSHNIYRKLRLYHENTGKPVYTFAEELAASGGYFILSAGDKAFADRSSLIGSVGVILMRPEYRNMVERFGIKPEILASNK